jgi:hypothetical protein
VVVVQQPNYTLRLRPAPLLDVPNSWESGIFAIQGVVGMGWRQADDFHTELLLLVSSQLGTCKS